MIAGLGSCLPAFAVNYRPIERTRAPLYAGVRVDGFRVFFRPAHAKPMEMGFVRMPRPRGGTTEYSA